MSSGKLVLRVVSCTVGTSLRAPDDGVLLGFTLRQQQQNSPSTNTIQLSFKGSRVNSQLFFPLLPPLRFLISQLAAKLHFHPKTKIRTSCICVGFSSGRFGQNKLDASPPHKHCNQTCTPSSIFLRRDCSKNTPFIHESPKTDH